MNSPASSPKKRLGQHFLKDPNTARIVARGVTGEDVVLEIGPGRGFLTAVLAGRAKLVHAVELDPDLLPILDAAVGRKDNVRLHAGDALSFDYATLDPVPGKLVANLPYNIASPLILKLLEEHPRIDVLRFMVQYEVAARMAARRGGKDYGAYAVLVQLLAEVGIEHKVSPRVFDPPPRVNSAVVEMRRRGVGLRPGEYEGVKRLVLAAFKSRRKQLSNNLPEPAKRRAPPALRSIGHGPAARAEELAPEDFLKLYRELSWAL
ncbi:MAG: 16S rRNA (adenine(1518)-N(6)/adenine(1519)-N(6))-dimethyltransferase RsmA [Rubrobacteraceae bacterium]